VEEFGRDIYKLVKTFTQKAKQANKSRDIGGGVNYCTPRAVLIVCVLRLGEVNQRAKKILHFLL